MGPKNVTARSLYHGLKTFLADRFDLSEGKASEEATILEIEQNIVFRGANLWILIFAIMVASVGLDVNSTAVVIGAMLISPLMGPIMGIGLGVGINNFDLIVQAFKNLGIAVLISILTSALYFWISPLDEAQSELLARTSPTLWDVLIALFGGFAGIVAGSRAEKTNAIPGVAIATALMPPLCTAGFGLASGQWNYFLGACYLFWINSVMISVATYAIVRLLRFQPKKFLDPKREKRVKRYIAIFVIATLIPSVYTAFNVVRESLFRRNANEFIKEEFVFTNAQVISQDLKYHRQGCEIDVTLYGAPISDEIMHRIEQKMASYNLSNCDLNVVQGHYQEGPDLATITRLNERLRTGIIEDLYKKNEQQIKTRDDRIQVLESALIQYKEKEIPVDDLMREVRAIDQNVSSISVASALVSTVDSTAQDTLYLAYLHFDGKATKTQLDKLETWLKARINTQKLKLVVD